MTKKIYRNILETKKHHETGLLELYVVGMPRSGSRYFYDVISCISKRCSDIKILNEDGHGKQHLKYSENLNLDKSRRVFGIYRDLRDVLVSIYHYVLRREAMKEDQIPSGYIRESIGSHPLYSSIEGLDEESALNRLILHKDCLPRYNRWLHGYWNKEYVSLVSFEEATSNKSIELFACMFRNAGKSVSRKIIEEVIYENRIESRRLANPIHVNNGCVGKRHTHLTHQQVKAIEILFSRFFKITEYQTAKVDYNIPLIISIYRKLLVKFVLSQKARRFLSWRQRFWLITTLS